MAANLCNLHANPKPAVDSVETLTDILTRAKRKINIY